LVSPLPLEFLSPGNGGIEGGVKTIEDGRGCLYRLSFSTPLACALDDIGGIYENNLEASGTCVRAL